MAIETNYKIDIEVHLKTLKRPKTYKLQQGQINNNC